MQDGEKPLFRFGWLTQLVPLGLCDTEGLLREVASVAVIPTQRKGEAVSRLIVCFAELLKVRRDLTGIATLGRGRLVMKIGHGGARGIAGEAAFPCVRATEFRNSAANSRDR